MYREYFIEAQEKLRRQGLKPLLRQGAPLSEAEIAAVDRRTDHPMPEELRAFYVEMGDGFGFVPNDGSEAPPAGWERNWLHDYAISNHGFTTQIEEELSREVASDHPRVDLEILHHEAERRKSWIPFYGFCGNGDVLCLDAEGKVQFYQAMDWTASPQLCRGFVLADSFTDFVSRWSKYLFMSPESCFGWTSFCWNRSGVFDWAALHFANYNATRL